MTVTMRPAARCGQPVAAAPATTALPAAARPAGPATASWPTLGTTAALAVTDPALLPAARDLLAAEIAAVDAACSSFRDDSEITAVNAAARQHGGPVRVSPLLAEAIGAALRAARQTGGDVDPLAGPGYRVTAAIRAAAQAGRDAGAPAGPRTRAAAPGEPAEPRPAGAPAAAPLAVVTSAGWRHVRLDAARGLVSLPPGSRLDLGGTAKAVAADRAAASIAARLGCGVLVCIGGDVAAGGEAPPGGWRVRVQAAGTVTAAADVPTAVVSIRGGGLATAGPGAARWHRGGDVLAHLLSPRGRALAASRWRLASVTAATCVEARAASIAAIISGDGAAGWLAARGLPARLVDAAGRATTVAGWPAEPGRPGWSGLITTGGGGHRAGGHRAGEAPRSGNALRTTEARR